jgi:hypothetical protein
VRASPAHEADARRHAAARKKGRLKGGPKFWEETPIGAQALTRQGRENALHNIERLWKDFKPKFSFIMR